MGARLPDAASTLGKTGRRVSPVGFGTYRVDDRVALHRAALEAALEAGVSLIDTSTNYGDGHSESLVGDVFASLPAAAREHVFVVTKAGYIQGGNLTRASLREEQGRPYPEVVKLGRDLWHAISPEFLRDQLGESLERLRLTRVDALLLHNPEYFLESAHRRGVPLEEARGAFYERVSRAFEALEDEVAARRIGAYGVSSNTFVVPRERADAVDLGRVLAASGPGFSVIQLPMNPLELGALQKAHTEDGRSVLDVAKEADLGVLVNRPLNAIVKSGLVRFASPRLPFTPPAARGDPFAELDELEAEFARSWGRRLQAAEGAPSIPDLLALAEILREVKTGVSDLATFSEIWEGHVAPRLTQLLPQLSELFAKDPAFARFADRFSSAALRAGALAAEPSLASTGRRVGELEAAVKQAFGDTGAGTISQRTVRGLAATPGVDCVLVGMRRPEYVQDVVEAFA
ncbi:MAG TPA: aldo/keto reductase [Thermoanaerobaculia bacterium]|nr:aldo/keto reductase [Thermoanaerobaculia bacterium]